MKIENEIYLRLRPKEDFIVPCGYWPLKAERWVLDSLSEGILDTRFVYLITVDADPQEKVIVIFPASGHSESALLVSGAAASEIVFMMELEGMLIPGTRHPLVVSGLPVE